MRTLTELMGLDGRVAVVTGGAGHIGRVIAGTLAEQGAAVAVVDCHEDGCHSAAEQIQQIHRRGTVGLVADLSCDQQTRALPGRVLEHFGQLDILVNCAAFVGTSRLSGWATSFEQQSVEAWRKAMDLNLTVPFVLAQSCREALACSGHGCIINIASIYGVVAPDLGLYEGTSMANPAAYGASKAGLLQLTRHLAAILAPKVRVNAITPGGVERNQPEIFQRRYQARTPLGRLATEEDLKGAVAYLASDLSAYVTGQNLIVDGGWTIW